MRLRTPAVIAVALASVAACAGSDDAGDTLPEVTLFTTTTTTTTTEPPPETVPATEAPVETSTSSTTTTVAPTTTVTVAPTTEVVPADVFVLGSDGLGPAAFGADPEGIIGFISSYLGPPTADTGYVDPFDFGVCSGTQARRVFWGSLMLEFGDASNVADGRLHFYAYEYGTEDPGGLAPGTPEGLSTAEGIGLGSTVDDLVSTYPTATFIDPDDFISATVVVNDNFRGRLTGLTRADTVTVFVGGLPCEG